MLEELWGGVSDILGDGLSSMLESILNATIFKLFYYLERALCWIIGILMDLFEVFAGLEPVTYNGQQDYLINVFFSNKAISNIYWAMAIIGVALIFVFTLWAVIKKMFDLEGKQQQSMGQIIWSAIRSLFLIVGLTLVVSVVLNATGVLMRQVDYIFNNAYHLDQPQEREFSDEEYAAMGRVLATIGNYSMIPNSDNRYNLNLCFNDIRADMYFLQQQGVFDYSYSTNRTRDANGLVEISWQEMLSLIAKSTDLLQDVSVDVYHEGLARSIKSVMEYLQVNNNPRPLSKVETNYTVSERTHLDRMIFLLGTFRAAKNSAFNESPAFDDALRGPYYYNDGRSIYDYDNVNDDFNIGFQTDYLLVWFASMALIFNLVVIILNCVARIFNMLLLYIIAPPFIASAPLDNGGKFRQWTIAFTIQSLSVFGTVIAMQLMLIYLPIVASPELVLFKDKPLLNAIAQFMLVYGGSEAAKKAGSLVTGILADQAGMEAIRSGDMSGAAGRAINRASSVVSGVAGAAAGVAGFVMSPVTNLAKRPFKAIGDAWKKLGSGGAQARADKAIQEEIAKNKAIEKYKQSHPEDAKYLGGGGSGNTGNGQGQQPSPPPQQNQTQPPNGQQPNQAPPGNGPGPAQPPAAQPPVIPDRGRRDPQAPKAFEAEEAPRRAPQPGGRIADIRQRGGFDEGPYGDRGGPGGQGGAQGGDFPPQQGGGQGAVPGAVPGAGPGAVPPAEPNRVPAGGPNRGAGGGPVAGPNGGAGGRPAQRPAAQRAREMNESRGRYSLNTPPPAQPQRRNNDPNQAQRQNVNQNQMRQQNNGLNQAQAQQFQGPQQQVPQQNQQQGYVPPQNQQQGYVPPQNQQQNPNPNPAGPNDAVNPQPPVNPEGQIGDPPKQEGVGDPLPRQSNLRPGLRADRTGQPPRQEGYRPQQPTGTVNNNQVPPQVQPQYQVPPQNRNQAPPQGENRPRQPRGTVNNDQVPPQGQRQPQQGTGPRPDQNRDRPGGDRPGGLPGSARGNNRQ